MPMLDDQAAVTPRLSSVGTADWTAWEWPLHVAWALSQDGSLGVAGHPAWQFVQGHLGPGKGHDDEDDAKCIHIVKLHLLIVETREQEPKRAGDSYKWVIVGAIQLHFGNSKKKNSMRAENIHYCLLYCTVLCLLRALNTYDPCLCVAPPTQICLWKDATDTQHLPCLKVFTQVQPPQVS